ncbi:exonuclease domain-containing protein [Escherichia coli]
MTIYPAWSSINYRYYPAGSTGERRNEAAFAARIHSLFTVPKTCILGYNNVRFDDEVTRNVFYRNFYDPYAWSWQHDNSRWDLLDVMRACYALRPEGINWPENDDGLPSFRLEHLTKANGIEHSNAHDAMATCTPLLRWRNWLKRVSHACLIISLPIVINTN